MGVSGVENCLTVFMKRFWALPPRRISSMLTPYFCLTPSPARVLPHTSEPWGTLARKRLLERLYSLTSSSRLLPEPPAVRDFCFLLRNHLLSGSSTRMPTSTQIMPTGRKEKNERGAKPASESVSLIIRLGGVPMSVIMPPMLLAKARGISRRLELAFALAAMLTTIGSIRATVPVLLTKAPMQAVVSTTSRKSLSSLLPASLRILLLIIFARPVRNMPPPTMNSPTIIITVELEKPERASSGVSIWKITSASIAHSATRSERTVPLTKKMTETSRIMSVTSISRKYRKMSGKMQLSRQAKVQDEISLKFQAAPSLPCGSLCFRTFASM